jgi:hypothetical protein
VKSSTNNTGGAWRDKKQPVGEAIDGRLMSDFIYTQMQKRPFENIIFMDEPAILKLPEIDQAVVIRDLGEIKEKGSKKFYLPGFSALHEKAGAEIALKNGSKNPYAFWSEHYVRVAGRALGEFAARTGLQFDSPHSQNFLIELDENMKPTGRLVLRDMSDLYVDLKVVGALQGEDSEILKNFTQKENMLSYTAAAFGPLHGNKKPAWVSERRYSKWKDVFYEEYKNSFRAVSGYDLNVLNAPVTKRRDYFSVGYDLTHKEAFNNLFTMMRAEGVVNNYGGALSCGYLFSGEAD